MLHGGDGGSTGAHNSVVQASDAGQPNYWCGPKRLTLRAADWIGEPHTFICSLPHTFPVHDPKAATTKSMFPKEGYVLDVDANPAYYQ